MADTAKKVDKDQEFLNRYSDLKMSGPKDILEEYKRRKKKIRRDLYQSLDEIALRFHRAGESEEEIMEHLLEMHMELVANFGALSQLFEIELHKNIGTVIKLSEKIDELEGKENMPPKPHLTLIKS